MEPGRIETLFLDAGGVLVFPNWTRVSDALAQNGVAARADALAAAEPHAKFEIDSDTSMAAASDAQRGWRYMHLVLEHAGVVWSAACDAALLELAAYHAEHNLWEHVPDNVVPVLRRLRAMGLRLVVVSNANGALHRMFTRVGLAPHFDCICDSCVEGVEKPDPRFFEIGLARSGADARTTLHVGDLFHVDVVGARRAGLRAALLDAADLYGGYDCVRVRDLDALVDLVARTNGQSAGHTPPS